MAVIRNLEIKRPYKYMYLSVIVRLGFHCKKFNCVTGLDKREKTSIYRSYNLIVFCRDRRNIQQTWQRLGIPGPKSSSLLFGNLKEVLDAVWFLK